ncbi:HopJ type III effector protein, partial [Polaribacter sp.]|nr:HopJ type III effector protein [Polaribacter sp.]
MQVIEDYYTFNPTAFANGDIINSAGENNGSCKLFAFTMHQEFTKEETLLCFGEHYQTILKDKNGSSHQNIRNFIQTGFKGLSFENEALTLKK